MCCCIHNIICTYDGTELVEIRAADPANEFDPDVYRLTAYAVPTAADCDFMVRRRDGIATAMWKDYVEEHARRGNPVANTQGD